MYVLLYMFMLHLPWWFVIRFLYDITCQLEQSARLWAFLPPEMLAQLQFAVSVCQMLLHPQRRRFFGLSDSEGCERFWHSISKPIGYLRVSGIHHLQQASIRCLGAWLARRWAHTQEKQREATEVLEECTQPMSLLWAEYKKQLAAQTKPLLKRTRNAGKIAIEEVLRLQKVLVVLQARDLQSTTVKLCKHEATLRAKEAALGVVDKQMLRHLLKSEYIRCQMNTRVLKYRIWEKLRNCKFELDHVEQTFHRKKATDPKLKTHIEDAVKRRDWGIQELIRNYNKLCAQIASLIKRNKAPKNAIAPEPIDPKSIWGLDVDDEIWQDVGLDDAYDDQEPPLWLNDEAVCRGIKAMLELDRCLEEELRDVVTSAKAVAAEDGNAGVVHQLKLRQQYLTQLCATWKAAIRPIPFKAEGLPAWGPSEEELMAVRIEDVVSKTTKAYDDNNNNNTSSEEEDDDDLPIEDIEAFQRGQVYVDEWAHYYASGDVHDDWGMWTDDDTWFST
ncbi:hypothetical protein B0H13DRAFT_1875522 [Mycena leptocephala]|nr:hypothetical protein B0H13DRAFT_1875522 [Mycena leptocephala]